jgi:hypothetical protein
LRFSVSCIRRLKGLYAGDIFPLNHAFSGDSFFEKITPILGRSFAAAFAVRGRCGAWWALQVWERWTFACFGMIAI